MSIKSFINLDSSSISESIKRVFENARENFEEYRALCEEAKKLMSEQQSLSAQITEKIDRASKEQTKWEKIFDLEDPTVKAIRKKIEQEKEIKKLAEKYMNDPEKQNLVNAILETRNLNPASLEDTEGGWLYETLGDAGGIFKDELAKSLSDFENFGEGMKSLGNELANYMIQQGVDALAEIAIQALQTSKIIQSIKTGTKSNGFFGTLTTAVTAIFGGKKHHSGGVILPTSNTLPGTEEQLAMLKGGERVLSPSETASYNNQESDGSQPVVFVNNNIKAWDSKDVKQYLLDNASLINSITAQGIRDNKHYLRTMIRNA